MSDVVVVEEIRGAPFGPGRPAGCFVFRPKRYLCWGAHYRSRSFQLIDKRADTVGTH
jgi:hypothetical protein